MMSDKWNKLKGKKKINIRNELSKISEKTPKYQWKRNLMDPIGRF